MIFFGDSIVAGYGAVNGRNWIDIAMEGMEYKNLGVNGSTSYDVLENIDYYVSLDSKDFFLIVGGNDILMGDCVSHLLSNLKSIRDKFIENNKRLFFGIPITMDENAVENGWIHSVFFQSFLNKDLKFQREVYSVFPREHVLDFNKFGVKNTEELFFDGMHPSTKGNIVMAEIFKDFYENTIK